MAAKWTKYYKIVTPGVTTDVTKMTDSQEMADAGAYNNYSWYQRLIQGSASRMTRYREYELMDADIEVSRALDTIAEEMIGNNSKIKEIFEIEVLTNDEEEVSSTAVLTLKSAMRRWTFIQNLEQRLYHIARQTVKYGDVFFRKGKNEFGRWEFVHPKNVVAAVVDTDDVHKIVAWQVRKDTDKPLMGGYGMPLGGKSDSRDMTEIVPAKNMIRFAINDDMSESQPFGESVLRVVYRSHKQKELLEDAVIIYRIQRAPERRIFYIDVGKMPPPRVKAYLETIKNEIKQKKVPTVNGGQSEMDSTYNPQSMGEDFFFSVRPDGRGSRVETLPGGTNLGETSDLEYFQRKVWRGLKVPVSYMIEQNEGGQIWNDGKVGVAYIQELRFSLYIERLQIYLEQTFDKEFKLFLREMNIHIDESMYRLRLPEPSNFGKYKQLEMDSQLLSSFGSADGIAYMSKRYVMRRYLQLTDEEIIQNERMKREEMGMNVERNQPGDLQKIYNSEGAGMDGGIGGGVGGGGFGADLGGGFGGAEMGMDAGGAEGGASGEGGAGGAGGGGSAPPPPPAS